MCIAVDAKYVQITGSPAAGILLSQLCYWAKKVKQAWFYKTQSEWSQETGLTRHRIEGAQKALMKLGLVEIQKRGLPAKNYYRVNLEKMQQKLSEIEAAVAANQTTSHRESGVLVSGKTEQQYAEKPLTSDRKNGVLYAENRTTSDRKSGALVAAKAEDLLHKITTKTTHKINTKITTEEPSVSQTLDAVVDKKTVVTIFNHWKAVMGHVKAQLDDKRRVLIRKALKMGYGTDQLCQAITGCSLTPHNQGHNDRGQRYDGLHIILRDAEQIDRFMRNADNPPQSLNKAQIRERQNDAVVHSVMARLESGELVL